jgi:four helix bundle protein
MTVQSYRELIAWQKAMDLVVEVYKATATFPSDERFGLTNQLRRASVSVPSNIAEGQGRGPTQDFVRFLGIARGSIQEVDTQLILASRLGFLPQDQYDRIAGLIVEVAKLINGLIRSIPS